MKPNRPAILLIAALFAVPAVALAKPAKKHPPKHEEEASKADCSKADICEQVLCRQPAAQELPGDLSEKRRKIIETAASMIGKVSERGGEAHLKKGWENELQFYKVAYGKQDDEKWPPKNLLDQIKASSMPTDRDKRVQPYSWCGIFALWGVKSGTGRSEVKWAGGPKGLGSPHFGSKGVQPGDIVVIKDPPGTPKEKLLVHHAVLE